MNSLTSTQFQYHSNHSVLSNREIGFNLNANHLSIKVIDQRVLAQFFKLIAKIFAEFHKRTNIVLFDNLSNTANATALTHSQQIEENFIVKDATQDIYDIIKSKSLLILAEEHKLDSPEKLLATLSERINTIVQPLIQQALEITSNDTNVLDPSLSSTTIAPQFETVSFKTSTLLAANEQILTTKEKTAEVALSTFLEASNAKTSLDTPISETDSTLASLSNDDILAETSDLQTEANAIQKIKKTAQTAPKIEEGRSWKKWLFVGATISAGLAIAEILKTLPTLPLEQTSQNANNTSNQIAIFHAPKTFPKFSTDHSQTLPDISKFPSFYIPFSYSPPDQTQLTDLTLTLYRQPITCALSHDLKPTFNKLISDLPKINNTVQRFLQTFKLTHINLNQDLATYKAITLPLISFNNRNSNAIPNLHTSSSNAFITSAQESYLPFTQDDYYRPEEVLAPINDTHSPAINNAAKIGEQRDLFGFSTLSASHFNETEISLNNNFNLISSLSLINLNPLKNTRVIPPSQIDFKDNITTKDSKKLEKTEQVPQVPEAISTQTLEINSKLSELAILNAKYDEIKKILENDSDQLSMIELKGLNHHVEELGKECWNVINFASFYRQKNHPQLEPIKHNANELASNLEKLLPIIKQRMKTWTDVVIGVFKYLLAIPLAYIAKEAKSFLISGQWRNKNIAKLYLEKNQRYIYNKLVARNIIAPHNTPLIPSEAAVLPSATPSSTIASPTPSVPHTGVAGGLDLPLTSTTNSQPSTLPVSLNRKKKKTREPNTIQVNSNDHFIVPSNNATLAPLTSATVQAVEPLPVHDEEKDGEFVDETVPADPNAQSQASTTTTTASTPTRSFWDYFRFWP